MRALGRLAAAASVLLLATAVPATAGGGKPAKGKPKAPTPDKPKETLPPGCTRLSDGYGAVVSPDGKWIASVSGGPVARLFGKPLAPTPLELVVTEAKTGLSSVVPVRARPVGWVASTLLVDTGSGVDPVKGTRATQVAALPPGATAASLAWTRDGKRLAWLPSASPKATTSLRVVGLDGKDSALDGSKGIRADQTAFLAWSPDGSKLYVNALFQDAADKLPVRWVGFVDAQTGAMSVLASMPDWLSIPGLSDDYPYYRDPRIENPDTIDLEYGRPAEPRYGAQVMSADGKRAVWLAGTGWIEADVFVVETASGAIHRVTNDGDVKWSPAIDPAGRRVAFLTADGVTRLDEITKPRIRVVDLVTGEPTEVAIAISPAAAASPTLTGAATPAWLTWSADGTALRYDVRGLSTNGSFSQTVPAAKPAPPDAPVKALEYDAKSRIIAWLSSYDADRVHTAVHRVEDAWDPQFLPALLETLAAWKDKEATAVHCLVHLLDLRQVKETVPNLRQALSSKVESNRIDILVALLHLGEKDALDELEKIRSTSKDADARYGVGLAMVRAGDERGWPSVAEAAKSDSLFQRFELCRALAKIKHPRSVDILIPLVADKRLDPVVEKLRASSIKVPASLLETVSPVAQLALEALTGKRLGDDPAKWTAWWKNEAKQTLPENVPPVKDPEHRLGR